MTREALTVPLRVRITQSERDRCQQAMERLGVVEFSVFVRWALENSVAQVLGAPQKQKPAPRRRPAPPPTLTVVREDAPPALPPVARPAQPAQPSALFGIPLYTPQGVNAPRPAPDVEDEDWV